MGHSLARFYLSRPSALRIGLWVAPYDSIREGMCALHRNSAETRPPSRASRRPLGPSSAEFVLYVSFCTHLPTTRAATGDSGYGRGYGSSAAPRHDTDASPPAVHSDISASPRPPNVHARQLLGRIVVSRAAREAHLPEADALRSQPAAVPRRHPPDDTATVGWGGG